MKLISFLLGISVGAQISEAFTVSIPRSQQLGAARSFRSTTIEMGFFDGVMKAFGNEEVRGSFLEKFVWEI